MEPLILFSWVLKLLSKKRKKALFDALEKVKSGKQLRPFLLVRAIRSTPVVHRRGRI